MIVSNGKGETSLEGVSFGGQMEEADSRLILHTADVANTGGKTVIIRSTDTDVVAIAISHYSRLQSFGLKELWILYGVGNSSRYLPIHDIAVALGEKSQALIGFHAFTGCDSVSFFAGKGKKSAWKIWNSFPEATTAFHTLSATGGEASIDFQLLEKFTVLLYDRHSSCKTVDQARKDLFMRQNKPLVLIPPTSAALRQHALRAAFQAGWIWGQATETNPEVPSPASWGWRKTPQQSWQPLWTTKPSIWEACRELDICGCKKNCDTQRCSCRKSGLACTPACKSCKGLCENKR